MQNFDRRTFLRIGAQATATTVLAMSGAAGAASNEQASRFRKGIKQGMVKLDGPLLQQFDTLKRLGFEGIELSQPMDIQEVNQAQRESGLVVHGVISYDQWEQPLSDPDPGVRKSGLNNLLTSLRDAKAYGATSVLLVPGRCTKEVSYDVAYKRSQAGIREALPLADELNVDILIENVWNDYLYSPLEMARFIDEFESPRVGAYFDVGNSVRYGWPEQWLRILGSRVKKLDIKEFSRDLMNTKGPESGFNVELGEGDCDWPAVNRAIVDIGYSGWAAAEMPGGGEARLREISERMDRVLSTTS